MKTPIDIMTASSSSVSSAGRFMAVRATAALLYATPAAVFDFRSTRGAPEELSARAVGSITRASSWIGVQTMLRKNATSVTVSENE